MKKSNKQYMAESIALEVARKIRNDIGMSFRNFQDDMSEESVKEIEDHINKHIDICHELLDKLRP